MSAAVANAFGTAAIAVNQVINVFGMHKKPKVPKIS
jgi:hypothetical protein